MAVLIFHVPTPQQEHRDLTDNAWQKLRGIVAEGEGLLKEAKELLWGWRLPPVVSVVMDGTEMDQLGKCSKAIKVSHPNLSLASYPVNLLAYMYVCVSAFGLCVVCAHIPNEVGGRERCTHADTDINKEIHGPLNILIYVYIRI